MLNLFGRLPRAVSEADKLDIVRQNIDPYYIHSLGSKLYDIGSVNDLLIECKKLEKTRNLAASRPTAKRIHFLEQDLAGPSSSNFLPRNRVERISEVVCWNWNEKGHNFSKCKKRRDKKFCFRCGKENVTKYTCSCKQENGSRDH